MFFFQGTQERVRNNRGKRAIRVRATEFLLYMEFRWLDDLVGRSFLALSDNISVYIGPSPREREKEKRSDRWEKKMSKQPPPIPTASTIGPGPTVIQVSRTPRHWKFTQHLRTTRPPLWLEEWLDVLFDSISVISGQWAGDNERLCAMELRLRLKSGVELLAPSLRSA